MQKNETLQLKCCLKQWEDCCWSFLSKVTLPWPSPAHHLGGWKWLTDLSRLAGTLAFLSKSISYLCFQASSGWEGHAQCQLPVTLPVAHSKVLHPSAGSWWISNSHSGGTGYLCASICCASLLILFWTPHWGRNKSSRWQVWGVTARKTMKSSRAIPMGTIVFVTPDVM